jgi:hypothetical protein
MRRTRKITTVLGGFAVASMLALSSPGVRVVQAADEVAGDTGAAALCEAGAVRSANEVSSYLQEIQRLQDEQVAEQLAAPRSDDEAVVLNNRGYNYDKPGFSFPRAGEIDGR